MSELYNVYSCNKAGEDALKFLTPLALIVAKEFPGLCASAFAEELRWRVYPRPDESDILDLILHMVCDGQLIYYENWKVRLP